MRNNPGERDRSIDALLRRQREDATASGATEQCVDAETLAAWFDGALAGEELAAAERHSAGCARCQAMLASMARIAPAIATPPWWRTQAIRWVVPVAAAATALVLWVAVDRERTAPTAPVSAPAAVDRSEAAPPTSAAPSSFAESRAKLPEPQVRRRLDEDKDAAARPAAVLGGAADARAIDALRPSPQTPSDNKASIGAPGASTPAPAAPPPPAASAPPPVAPAAESVTVVSEPSARALFQAGRAGSAGIAVTIVDATSPEPAFRWRLSAPASIQRSTDGGLTWTTQAAPAGMVLTAGSSPARDVCWIVGRASAVALSTDGSTWRPRPFPEAANLTAVRAIDAKSAIVTTEDGRQFSTTDGGATWSKLPLQEK